MKQSNQEQVRAEQNIPQPAEGIEQQTGCDEPEIFCFPPGQKIIASQHDGQKQKQEKSAEEKQETSKKKKRWGNGNARIGALSVCDKNGTEQRVFQTGEPIRLQFSYQVKQPVQDAVFGIGIFRQDGVQCYGTNTRIDKQDAFDLEQDGTVTIELDSVLLLPGTYLLDLAIECGDGIPVDYVKEAVTIQMTSAGGDVGVMRIPHRWKRS